MKLREILAAKIVAFILLLACLAATVMSAFGSCVVLFNPEFSKNVDAIYDELFSVRCYDIGSNLYQRYQAGGAENLPPQESYGNLRYAIYNDAGVLVSPPTDPLEHSRIMYELSFSGDYDNHTTYFNETTMPTSEGGLRLVLTLDTSFPIRDEFYSVYNLVQGPLDTLQRIGHGVIALFAVSALASLGLLIFLSCAVGHKRGVEGIHLNPLTRTLPFDLLFALFAFVGFCTVSLGIVSVDYASHWQSAQLIPGLLGLAIGAVLTASLAILLFLDFILRIKHGKIWRNTIIYRLLRFVGRFLMNTVHTLGHGLSYLPLLPKTCLLSVGLACLFVIPLFPYDGSIRFLLWLCSSALLLVILLALGAMLHSLHKGSRALAEGKFDYRVDDTRLYFDFKEIGQNLNKSAQGLSLAVEDRLKSERMKTELITNVSHDIKTPLTSIINYADLIAKEENKSETIRAYSAVLLRQSERLKKLLEDLVEASKVSSGTMDVNLAPIELGVLLTQAAAEYETRLEEQNLLLVVKQPEAPLRVMADGRLLWRVFDNLMGNITKYAQSGTRVYLTLEQQANTAVISFKNTSSYPLDLPAEDLLERFSRGDASRHTEGNGLGLSIAQNLVALQGGTLSLTVDGDLFKVMLRFAQAQDGQTPTQASDAYTQTEQPSLHEANRAEQIIDLACKSIESAGKSIEGAGKRVFGHWNPNRKKKEKP